MTQILDTLLVEGNARSTAQGLFLGGVLEMPEAAEGSRDCIVFYAGPPGAYTPFSFYRCTTDDDGASYHWTPVVVALDIAVSRAMTSVQTYQTINGHDLTGNIYLTAKDVDALPSNTLIPTKLSQLSNDGVYITQDCSTMANYWTKEQMKNVLRPYARIIPVDSLPADDAIDPHAFYAVREGDGRKLYYRVDGQWYPVA